MPSISSSFNGIFFIPLAPMSLWVHRGSIPTRSGATAMELTKVVPNAVISNIDSVAQWFRANVSPVTGFSENIIGISGASVGSLFHAKTAPVQSENDEDEAAFVFDEELRPVAVDFAYAENVQGLSQEALLLLKRGNAYDWGPWEDYDRYVPMLVDAEKAHKKPDSVAENLKIDVFFAETDVMIGNSAGPKWFAECWKSVIRGLDIEYSSKFVKGANHDGIFNLRWGAVQQVFAEAKARSSES